MSRNEKTESKNRKTLFAVLLLLIAFAIIIGSIFAFFSDFVTGTVDGTAGTLDLTTQDELGQETKKIRVNGVDVNSSIANLNPGDIVEISYDVRNAGNKSAYLRDVVSLVVDNYSGTNLPVDAFAIYDGTRHSSAAIQQGTATPFAITPSTTNVASDTLSYTTSPAIINGTGTDAEIETLGTGTVTVNYKLYFKPSAGNDYQQVKVDFTVSTQAVQYRNNTSLDWNQVTEATFGL